MLTVSVHTGSREPLMPLFSEADDSLNQIESYRNLGDVLVARDDDRIVGHVQIVEAEEPRAFEIKSIAVEEGRRSQGIGATLLQAAIERCRKQQGQVVWLATAAASTDALKFYQRQGFRIRRVIRDFYGPSRGYRPLLVNGIPLLDEVILDLEL